MDAFLIMFFIAVIVLLLAYAQTLIDDHIEKQIEELRELQEQWIKELERIMKEVE